MKQKEEEEKELTSTSVHEAGLFRPPFFAFRFILIFFIFFSSFYLCVAFIFPCHNLFRNFVRFQFWSLPRLDVFVISIIYDVSLINILIWFYVL